MIKHIIRTRGTTTRGKKSMKNTPVYTTEYEDHIEEDDPDIDANEDMDQDESEEGVNQDCHLFEDGDSSGEEDDDGYE